MNHIQLADACSVRTHVLPKDLALARVDQKMYQECPV
jgi:hypothetical protein